MIRTAAPSRLSEIHRKNHADTLRLASSARHDGATHARLMTLAKSCRFYFERLRILQE